tara:strand:+ start:629 stop:2131 length:1503 start_codon:yes stop_codon:yes gene_type:complete
MAGLVAKVEQVKATLGIEAATMPAAVQQANEVMGLSGEGAALPQQIATLMAALGLEDAAAAPLAAPAAPSDAPPPMQFSLRCSSGQTVAASARLTDSIGTLMLAVQRETGIHAAMQRLVFAGTALTATDTIDSTPLVNGSTIFVLVSQDAGFPAKLGPFQTAEVPFGARDLQCFVGPELSTSGCMWTMEQHAITRQRLACPGVEFPLVGQWSPTHPVTLTAAEKRAIHIPEAATQFVFSYPVVAGAKLSVQPGGSTSTDRALAEEGPVCVSFLSVGGFCYLDGSANLLHATTLLPSDRTDGGLQFSPPRRWEPQWTAALMRQGRFQRITIRPLNDLGAQHFCWLRPGEVIGGCATQPAVTHGGFAYLFHDSALGGTDDELMLDRYFAVASGEDYVADSGASASDVATFAVVGDLSSLNDLRDRLVAAAPQGADADELRGQIGQLETRLEQATRCCICLESQKDTMLGPCNHLCMCESCAAAVQACPVCRTRIRTRRRAYT